MHWRRWFFAAILAFPLALLAIALAVDSSALGTVLGIGAGAAADPAIAIGGLVAGIVFHRDLRIWLALIVAGAVAIAFLFGDPESPIYPLVYPVSAWALATWSAIPGLILSFRTP